MIRASAAVAALAIAAGAPAAAEPGPTDPIGWLHRAVSAARQTNYAGTVMHMQGERTTTSRITHVFRDSAELERIEALDGPRREVVRRDNQMQCFFPDAKTVRVDKRVTARFFPSIVEGPVESIAENYRIALGKVERVLDRECQWIHLDPKDALRYAQRLCAEVGSGLLLRAKTLGPRHQVLEQYTFTDLRTGRDVSRADLASPFISQSRTWRRDVQHVEERGPGTTGWVVSAPPAGFRVVGEMQRTLPHRPAPVTHLVLSDGFAAMSVFVEPMPNPPQKTDGTSEDGSLSVYIRPLGDSLVTVLGEVPPAAAQQVGMSIGRQTASAR